MHDSKVIVISPSELRELIKDCLHEDRKANPTLLKEKEQYLTYEQVSKLLGVTIPTIHSYVNAGTLTCYNVSSGTVRFKRSEIDEAITTRRKNGHKKGMR